MGLQKEYSQAWMGTKPGQFLPGVRGASFCIKSSQLKQLPAAFLKCGSRWGLEPRQGFAQTSTPECKIQHGGLGVSSLQLRNVVGWPSLLFGRRPKPDATTSVLASSTTSPLISTGLTSGHGDQALHSGARIELSVPSETAIDHKANTVQRERTFGDGRCQNHPSIVLAVARL
jgi:hypothetical protein